MAKMTIEIVLSIPNDNKQKRLEFIEKVIELVKYLFPDFDLISGQPPVTVTINEDNNEK